jgi:chromosome segregation ATPase
VSELIGAHAIEMASQEHVNLLRETIVALTAERDQQKKSLESQEALIEQQALTIGRMEREREQLLSKLDQLLSKLIDAQSLGHDLRGMVGDWREAAHDARERLSALAASHKKAVELLRDTIKYPFNHQLMGAAKENCPICAHEIAIEAFLATLEPAPAKEKNDD